MGTAKYLVIKTKKTRRVPKSSHNSSLDKCPNCGYKLKGNK